MDRVRNMNDKKKIKKIKSIVYAFTIGRSKSSFVVACFDSYGEYDAGSGISTRLPEVIPNIL